MGKYFIKGIVAGHCGLVVYMAFSHEVLAPVVSLWSQRYHNEAVSTLRIPNVVSLQDGGCRRESSDCWQSECWIT